MTVRHALGVLVATALLTACAAAPGVQRLSPSSLGCMRAVVRDKLPQNLPDKQAHCLAAGLIARYCSVPEAYVAGYGKDSPMSLTAGIPRSVISGPICWGFAVRLFRARLRRWPAAAPVNWPAASCPASRSHSRRECGIHGGNEVSLNIWARKPVEDLCAETGVDGEVTALPRSIGVFALTCIGVGATVGAGIFVLTGSVAAEHFRAGCRPLLRAGQHRVPAGRVVLCRTRGHDSGGRQRLFVYLRDHGRGHRLDRGLVSDARISVLASLVAISWAGYAQSTLHQMGFDLAATWTSAPFDVKDAWHIYRTPTFINLPAVLVTVACTLVLLGGLKTSARLNSVMVVAKVIAILVVVFVGAGHVHTLAMASLHSGEYRQFGVYGWSGVVQGTAILFFAYIGFDAVSTMGSGSTRSAAHHPLESVAGPGHLRGVVSGRELRGHGSGWATRTWGVPDPMYLALDRAGPSVLWAKYLVGFVAVAGLVSVLLVTLMGQVRIFYAMGRDGLLPPAFARVHPKTHTPHIGTIVTGIISCIAAGLLPLGLLGDIISMGTLLAFGIVCGGVLVLRRTRKDLRRPFKAPGGIWVPLAGALCCAGLMASLPRLAWIGFVFWLVVGAEVYVLYGATRSNLQRAARARAPGSSG